MPHPGQGWDIRYAASVVKEDIPALDHAVRERIRVAIASKLGTDPVRFGKPLRYSLQHLRSLRIGDYRVLYRIEPTEKCVSVVAIGHRRDIYIQ